MTDRQNTQIVFTCRLNPSGHSSSYTISRYCWGEGTAGIKIPEWKKALCPLPSYTCSFNTEFQDPRSPFGGLNLSSQTETISVETLALTRIDNLVRQFDTVVTVMELSHSLCKRHFFLLSLAFVTTNISPSIKQNRRPVTVGQTGRLC